MKPVQRTLPLAAGVALSSWFAIACGEDEAGSPDAAPGDAGEAGDDGGSGADAAAGAGSARIEGTLAEETLSPTTAYFIEAPFGVVIVMPDGGADCTLEEPEGTLTAMIGFPCGFGGAGTLSVAPTTTCGDLSTAWVLVEGFEGEIPDYRAGSGTVTIDTAGGGSITGSFEADFGDDGSLTGTFTAVVCDSG